MTIEPPEVPGVMAATTAPPADDAIPARPGSRGGPPRSDGSSHSANRDDGPERSWMRTAAEWLGFAVAALVIAFVVKTFVFQAFYIPSESMVPTLEVGDRVLVNKISYHLHHVHRGDIVVFDAPPGTKTAQIQDLVKRVIGLPGDRIEGHDGRIYINGKVLDEPWLPAGTQSRQFQCSDQLGCKDGRVPPGKMFVLGDNRLQSKDSTYFGPVEESGIVGRVFVRIWPLGRLAFIGPSYLMPLVIGIVIAGLGFLIFSLWSRRRRSSNSV